MRLTGFFVLVAGGSWAYLFYQAWQMSHLPMSQMRMPPMAFDAWSAGDLAWIFGMWAVMMVAMMLPSALPMFAAFTRYGRSSNADTALTLWLATGYFAVWLLFCVPLTALQWLLHSLSWLSPMMENRQPYLAAGMLVLAGGYQFTAFKNICLSHCRTPFGFLLQHWQAGGMGALRTGFSHGLHCLGCCWLQMLLMFAAGVMNLVAMLMLTALITLEKTAPVPATRLSAGIGVLLLGLAGYIAVNA